MVRWDAENAETVAESGRGSGGNIPIPLGIFPHLPRAPVSGFREGGKGKAPTPRPVHGETWLMGAELADLRAAIGEEATDGTDALD